MSEEFQQWINKNVFMKVDNVYHFHNGGQITGVEKLKKAFKDDYNGNIFNQ